MLLGSLWGVTTLAATTVAWAGVSVVTASVTAVHSPAIPARAVHAALSAPTSTTGREIGESTTAPPDTSTTTAPAPGAPPVPGPAGQLAAASGPPAQGASSGSNVELAPPPPSAPTTASPTLAAAPTAQTIRPQSTSGTTTVTHHYDGGEGGSSTTTPHTVPGGSGAPQSSSGSPVTATFSTSGGTVTVQCVGSTISLVTTSAFDGYGFTVMNSGPSSVSVSFSGQGHNSSVWARCSNGQPVRVTDS
jgi:hypothetical protein